MREITVSTCGTSIFTNRADRDEVDFIRANANKKESDYTPEDLARMNAIISDRRGKLLGAESLKDIQALSAELNGFISFYGKGKSLDINDAAGNTHYLIHTDTYQGVRRPD